MKRILLLFIAFSLLCGCSNKNESTTEEDISKKISEEYSVSITNPFKPITAEGILELFEDGTGAVFIGVPNDKSSSEFAQYLTRSADGQNVKTIYYIELNELKNDKNYKKVLSELIGCEKYEKDDIVAPLALFIEKGDVVGIEDGKELLSVKQVDANNTDKENATTYNKNVELILDNRMKCVTEFVCNKYCE